MERPAHDVELDAQDYLLNDLYYETEKYADGRDGWRNTIHHLETHRPDTGSASGLEYSFVTGWHTNVVTPNDNLGDIWRYVTDPTVNNPPTAPEPAGHFEHWAIVNGAPHDPLTNHDPLPAVAPVTTVKPASKAKPLAVKSRKVEVQYLSDKELLKRGVAASTIDYFLHKPKDYSYAPDDETEMATLRTDRPIRLLGKFTVDMLRKPFTVGVYQVGNEVWYGVDTRVKNSSGDWIVAGRQYWNNWQDLSDELDLMTVVTAGGQAIEAVIAGVILTDLSNGEPGNPRPSNRFAEPEVVGEPVEPLEGPSDIQFGQQGVSATFRNGEFAGQSVKDVAAGLRNGSINSSQLPIQTITRDGVTYTLNNRSLMALRLAEIEPTVVTDVTGNSFFEEQLTQRLSELGGQVDPNFVPIIRPGGQH